MNNKIFGYCRVSSKEQNEERQIVAFKEYGIDERLIKEKIDLEDMSMMQSLWRFADYETKCNFIGNYIDKIEISKCNCDKIK